MERLRAATKVELLSKRGNKKVTVMREPDGGTFVSRKYDDASELVGPSHWAGVNNFTDRWEMFKTIFADAPFSLLPSSVVYDGEDGAEMISAHRETIIPLREATLETKIQIVTYLTHCAIGKHNMQPALATIQADMFNVLRPPDGAEWVELLDVDPYLPLDMRYHHRGYKSTHSAELLDAVIDCMAGTAYEQGWSVSDDERISLARAMVSAIIEQFPGDKLNELLSPDNPLSIPFSIVHLMTNGVDARH